MKGTTLKPNNNRLAIASGIFLIAASLKFFLTDLDVDSTRELMLYSWLINVLTIFGIWLGLYMIFDKEES